MNQDKYRADGHADALAGKKAKGFATPDSWQARAYFTGWTQGVTEAQAALFESKQDEAALPKSELVQEFRILWAGDKKARDANRRCLATVARAQHTLKMAKIDKQMRAAKTARGGYRAGHNAPAPISHNIKRTSVMY